VNYFARSRRRLQGAVGAKWAKRMGAKKVYVSTTRSYTQGIADVFEANRERRSGFNVVANEGIDWKQPDQKPVLTKGPRLRRRPRLTSAA